MKLIDLTGQPFGRLTVIGRDTTRTDRPVHWICKCECGNTTSVSGQDLKSGNTQSCGCLNREVTSQRNTSDLTDQKFERLKVISRAPSNSKGVAMWNCKCECGNDVVVSGDHLRSGHTRSCGCLQRERVSEVRTKWKTQDEHDIADRFRDMKKRCCNPKAKEYHRYGGRGIKICDEWMQDRRKFVEWSLKEGGYAPGLTIERNDNDGPYAPWNCSWITKFKQESNRSTNVKFEIDGHVKTVAEWARFAGVSYEPLRKLLHENPEKFIDKITSIPDFEERLKEA